MMDRFLAKLANNRQGATIVEFALILPTLLLTLMGLFDMAHNMYTAQILNGAVQEAARNSTIQGTKSDRQALDREVKKAVLAIAREPRLPSRDLISRTSPMLVGPRIGVT